VILRTILLRELKDPFIVIYIYRFVFVVLLYVYDRLKMINNVEFCVI